MGFPSEGAEGIYRNKMSEVQRFFKMKHRSHFKVYRLRLCRFSCRFQLPRLDLASPALVPA